MSCLLSSMPLSTYARNRYFYMYHPFAYLNHRVHSSLLQSIKIAVMKKIIRLKFFKLFNCLQNDFGGNSCMFHCPWCGVHAWGPSSNPSRNQLSISLTLTKWRRVKSGQHTIYQCTVYKIYRMGGEPLRETERQKSTLMYKHMLAYQWLACVKININFTSKKLYLSPNLPKLFSLELAEFVISRFLYRNSCM